MDPMLSSQTAYDCEYTCEANKFGNDSLRMAGIVQMLHALYSLSISIYMPTEREHSDNNIDPSRSEPWYGERIPLHNEIKLDEKPTWRLRFLDSIEDVWYRSTASIGSLPCITCSAIRRAILYTLALYGLYSIFF